MAIPDPPKAGSPFCALWTGGWNPKTPKINNFFIPEITLRGGYSLISQSHIHTCGPVREQSISLLLLLGSGVWGVCVC